MSERMLIVDDSIMMRQMLASQLNALGHTDVRKAVNGLDAMSQLLDGIDKGEPFDVMLLDWAMPEMNGLELLVKCRNDQRFARMAIVMITAEGEQKNIMKALEVGATSYLTKPFSPQALQEKMKQVFEWLNSVRENAQVTNG